MAEIKVFTVKQLLDEKQYTRLRQALAELNEADIAGILQEMEEQDMLKVFRILPKDQAADVFSYLDVDNQQYVITSLSERDAGVIVDNLMADDAADLMEEMPANVVKKLLANASPGTRRDINHLLLSQPGDTIGEIMHENTISINTLTDQEEAAKAFQKYDFTAMPVVDNENRLVGIITVDDIVDILQEETTEDIEKMAAIVPTDKPYLKTGVLETWKKRIPWLLLLMVSATFTGKIIAGYESALSAYMVLSTFIPMLMDTGGNAGSQASVSIIRGISLDEIRFSDMPSILWKEMRVALLCGITLCAANFLKLMLIDRIEVTVAAVICLTLVVTVMAAKLVGSSLPLLARRLGIDPAVMASPFITTIVDALSLVIYFQIAVALLHI